MHDSVLEEEHILTTSGFPHLTVKIRPRDLIALYPDIQVLPNVLSSKGANEPPERRDRRKEKQEAKKDNSPPKG